jgi:lipopolysaccharide transport system permease protein
MVAATMIERSRGAAPAGLVIRPFDQRRISESLADIWQHRELLYILTHRAVVVRYKQAVVGVLWVVLQPLIATAIYTIVFSVFVQIPSEGLPYPLFAFSGLLSWGFFSRVIQEGSSSLLVNAALITKVYFPRSLLPLVPPAAAAIDCLISVVVVIVAAVLFFGFAPRLSMLWVPVIVVWLGVLGYAISLWLSPLHAIYRDFNYIVPFAVQIAMYLCPIIYPSALVPEPYRLLYSLNPMATLVDAMRWSLFGRPEPPTAVALAAAVILPILILVLGIRFFHRMEPVLVDRI